MRAPGRHMRARLVVAVVLAALAAACSSTDREDDAAAGSQRSPRAGRPAAGSGALTSSSIAGVVDDPSPASAGAAAVGGRTSGGAVAPAAGGHAPASDPIPVRPEDGPVSGVTDTEIRLGFERLNVADAPYLDGVELSRGDARLYAEATIADLNARGGLAGRTVTLVVHDYDSNRYYQQEAAACARFTEDEPVFAVTAQSYGHSDDFLACLDRWGIPYIEGGVAFRSTESFNQLPRYVNVGWIDLTRTPRVVADALAEAGRLGGLGEIGIVAYDGPLGRSVVEAWEAALARHGLEVAEVSYESESARASGNFAALQADAARSALVFKSEGIDTVIPASCDVCFLTAAEEQGYRPRYVLSSQNFPTQNLAWPTVDPNQFRGAFGVGWIPLIDVDAANDPGAWPARQRCLDVMAAAGITLPDRSAERGAMHHCETVWLLEEAVKRAGSLAPDRVIAAIDAMGTDFESASTFGTRFAPGRHDGADVIRLFEFVDDCMCFRYTSGERRIG